MSQSGKAKTVYFPSDVIKSLGNCSNLSATIAKRLRRYTEVMLKSRPSFTPPEWVFLQQCLGDYSADRPEHLRALAPMIRAWEPKEGQGRPPGVDPGSLAYRVEALPLAQLVALIEILEQLRTTTNADDSQ
jgi:hypothetical protein